VFINRKPGLRLESDAWLHRIRHVTQKSSNCHPVAGTHKRQISEAVPREERLNGPETTPAAPQQQAWGEPRRSRGQIQALAQALAQSMIPARVAGPGSLNGVTEVGCLSIAFLEMDELLRIARIAQSVTPVTVIHSTASAQSRVATRISLSMNC
jgi:hypothetical protein